MNLNRTRIKICGLTQKHDIDCAVALGVDAIGFVFYPPSKRYVAPEQASTLVRDLPAFVSTVALFVNPSKQDVQNVIEVLRPSLLQFHGDETAEFCASFGLPYLKAFRVGAPMLDSPEGLANFCAAFGNAAGWLFDSYTVAYGGSGQSFDYSLLSQVLEPQFKARPVVVSGGLNHSNVSQAIQTLKPWAVDVSSGVEQAPGLKSAEKMADFVNAVRLIDK